MTPFGVLRGRAVVLDRANVDTDQILPARFLRKPRSAGYQNFLFYDLREAEPGFPVRGDVAVVIAGANFGCGSSREGAVYALVDAGIRCVIAPSFGDIFAGNAAKNGLLTVTLADAATRLTDGPIEIDLPAQLVRCGDAAPIGFPIDAFRKRCLVEGLDDIGLTLVHADQLARFAATRPGWMTPCD
jgi:3-isopropylmalate/(R)-2-methylmalate dehydratase small subunit